MTTTLSPLELAAGCIAEAYLSYEVASPGRDGKLRAATWLRATVATVCTTFQLEAKPDEVLSLVIQLSGVATADGFVEHLRRRDVLTAQLLGRLQ